MEAELKQAYAQADEANRLMNGLVSYLRKNGPKKADKISKGVPHDTINSQGNLTDLEENDADDPQSD